jgi:hypothetical protein
MGLIQSTTGNISSLSDHTSDPTGMTLLLKVIDVVEGRCDPPTLSWIIQNHDDKHLMDPVIALLKASQFIVESTQNANDPEHQAYFEIYEAIVEICSRSEVVDDWPCAVGYLLLHEALETVVVVGKVYGFSPQGSR